MKETKKGYLKQIFFIAFLVLWLLFAMFSKTILRYEILFITILSGASFLGFIFKKGNEETIPVTLLSIMVILYIFGFFNALKIGAYIILVTFNILGLVTLLLSIHRKEFLELSTNVLSFGATIWYILFVIFMVTMHNRMFNIWDEFSCWSIASKNMYYLNSFVLDPKSTVILFYPPSPTILQYFFLKVVGIYKQGIELFATIMLGFSLVIPLFKITENKKANVVQAICAFILIISIPTIFCDKLFYITIYADPILGLLLGNLVYQLYTKNIKEQFNFISIALVSIILALTKSTGIILLAIVAFIYLLNLIINKYSTEKDKRKGFLKESGFKFYIVILIIALISSMAWRVYTEKNRKGDNGVINTTSTGNPVKYLVKVYLDTFLTYEKGYVDDNLKQDCDSVYNGSSAFFEEKNITEKPFNTSLSFWIVIFIALMLIEYKLINDNKEKKKFAIYSGLIVLGLFIYIFLLQVAFIFVFSNSEGIAHNSVQRYVGSYLICMLMFVIGSFIYNMKNFKIKESKTIWISLTLFVLLFTPFNTILNATIFSGEYNRNKIEILSSIEAESYRIKEKIDENDKIYIINQGVNSVGICLRYFLTPIQSSNVEILGEENKINSVESFEKVLNDGNYKYVYMVETNDYYTDTYKSMFENNEIKESSLYKINRDENGKITLSLVDNEEKGDD